MDRGIARDRELRHAQHIAVHVDIAVEHAGGRDVERGVFVGDVGLVVRGDRRRVTPGQQRQAERRPGRVAICIYEIDGNIEIHLCPGVEHGTANSGERKRYPRNSVGDGKAVEAIGGRDDDCRIIDYSIDETDPAGCWSIV